MGKSTKVLWAALLLAACYPVKLLPRETKDLRGGAAGFQSAQAEEAHQVITEYCDGGYTVTESRNSGSFVAQSFVCDWGAPRVVSEYAAGGFAGGILRHRTEDVAGAVHALQTYCDGGVTEVESHELRYGTTGLEFICGDTQATQDLANALKRRRTEKSHEASPDSSPPEQRALRFGVIDAPERGLLEVGSSHRVAGTFWEFVVAYTNNTGAPFRHVTVECVTLAGRRILNSNSRSEFDGVADGDQVVFKVPVEDVGEEPDHAGCRITKAVR